VHFQTTRERELQAGSEVFGIFAFETQRGLCGGRPGVDGAPGDFVAGVSVGKAEPEPWGLWAGSNTDPGLVPWRTSTSTWPSEPHWIPPSHSSMACSREEQDSSSWQVNAASVSLKWN
jgi:hypothetical protein